MKPCFGLAIAAMVLLSACGSKPTVVVGSKRSVEQNIVGEIVAQHLESHWQGEVRRRLNFGDTVLMHQAMLNGDVTVYPEYTGTVASEMLREEPSPNPDVTFERARGELKRRMQFAVLDPLGYDNRTILTIRAADGAGIDTISQAAARKEGWKIGISSDFEHTSNGLPTLSSYGLKQDAPVRSMPAEQLFPGLKDGSLSLIAAQATDGELLQSEWKALKDDKDAFPPQQAVLLVREDAFAEDASLRNVLQQLSGKITLEAIRKMVAQVKQDERLPADLAREFLQQAGLQK